MKFLGNLVWLLLGGLLTALMYWFAGLLMCISVIGIPFGVQLFKVGMLSLWPFGHDLVPKADSGSCLQIIFNVLWISSFVAGREVTTCPMKVKSLPACGWFKSTVTSASVTSTTVA